MNKKESISSDKIKQLEKELEEAKKEEKRLNKSTNYKSEVEKNSSDLNDKIKNYNQEAEVRVEPFNPNKTDNRNIQYHDPADKKEIKIPEIEKWIGAANLFNSIAILAFSALLAVTMTVRSLSFQTIESFINPIDGEVFALTSEGIKNWSDDINKTCAEAVVDGEITTDLAVLCLPGKNGANLAQYITEFLVTINNLSPNEKLDSNLVNEFYNEINNEMNSIIDELQRNDQISYFPDYKANDMFGWKPKQQMVNAFSVLVGIYGSAAIQSIIFRKKDPKSDKYLLSYGDVFSGFVALFLPGIKIYEIMKEDKNEKK